jgi:uncharacterized protein YndB with AHSA1/START domain
MAGKVDTGRAIVLEATLDAPPAAVFALWTTEEGLRRFFAPKAVIDPRPGGRYEIVFAPELDPEGDSAGTKGARILRFEPGRALSFEWHSFQRHALAGVPPGASGPPFAPEERDRRPLPSWVDLTFEPVAGEPGKTHLVLAHRGFEASERWEEARRYFWTAWASVLGRLGAACAAPESVAAIP